jgi:hypothetical protein
MGGGAVDTGTGPVATVAGAAALEAAGPASAWVTRRERQRQARGVGEAKLQAALARVSRLEEELASCRAQMVREALCHTAAAEQAAILALDPGVPGPLRKEVVGRLALAAPSLVAGLAAATGTPDAGLATLATARRNTAAHHFAVPVAAIAAASLPQLNQWQRQGRAAARPGPTLATATVAADTAAENHAATPADHTVVTLGQRLAERRRAARRISALAAVPRGGRRLGFGRVARGPALRPASLRHRPAPAVRTAADAIPILWACETRRNRTRLCRSRGPPARRLVTGPGWFQPEHDEHATGERRTEQFQIGGEDSESEYEASEIHSLGVESGIPGPDLGALEATPANSDTPTLAGGNHGYDASADVDANSDTPTLEGEDYDYDASADVDGVVERGTGPSARRRLLVLRGHVRCYDGLEAERDLRRPGWREDEGHVLSATPVNRGDAAHLRERAAELRKSGPSCFADLRFTYTGRGSAGGRRKPR